MKTSLLVVSFTLPPYPGIGGRRWSKFIKVLVRKGHLVKGVAARESLEDSSSEWIKDLEGLSGSIYYLNSRYPVYLGMKPENTLDKFRYRFSLLYAKFKSRGNYYDKSNYWEGTLLDKCREIIKTDNIRNLICSVPPFRSAFFIIQLKKEFPKLNFIIDYRDPWTNNRNSFGFVTLSKSRFRYEIEIEKRVLETADRILVVSREMSAYLLEIGGVAIRKKISHLPNGFDAEDFQLIEPKELVKSEEVKIYFSGTFYDKAVHVFENLVKVLEEIKLEDEKAFSKLRFYFVGTIPSKLKFYIKQCPNTFFYLGQKSLHETYNLIRSADYCSLFLTDDLQYSLSTKVYEYIASRKPILSFSTESGANAYFLEKNNLGCGITFSNAKDCLLKLGRGQDLVDFDAKFDLRPYEIHTIVKILEKLLL